MLNEIFLRIIDRKQGEEIKFGPVSVWVSKEAAQNQYLMSSIQDTTSNLRRARELGVEPLSMKEVINQLDSENGKKAVLFDTPPDGLSAGNHWRPVEIDVLKNTVKLQLCGTFGNYDFDDIPPLTVPLDTPFFTGLSLQEFEVDEIPVTLNQAASMVRESRKQETSYPDSLVHKGETIFWSNSDRQLVRGN